MGAAFGIRSRTGFLAVVALLTLGCAGRALLVRDDLTAKDLGALVDSDSARGLLADLLAHRSVTAPDLVQEAGTNANADQPALREQARLRELSQKVSLDFAALSFARAISADGMSHAVQASFYRFLQAGVADAELSLRRSGGFPNEVPLATAWRYRRATETGCGFAYQRLDLDRVGTVERTITRGRDQ